MMTTLISAVPVSLATLHRSIQWRLSFDSEALLTLFLLFDAWTLFALFNALTLFPLALNVSTRRLSFVLVALAGVSVSLLLLLDEISSLPSDTAEHLLRVLLVLARFIIPE